MMLFSVLKLQPQILDNYYDCFGAIFLPSHVTLIYLSMLFLVTDRLSIIEFRFLLIFEVYNLSCVSKGHLLVFTDKKPLKTADSSFSV